MFSGIIAGVTWAIETVVLGIALAMSPFCTTEEAIFLAPFVSTFLHDLFSAIFATIYIWKSSIFALAYDSHILFKAQSFIQTDYIFTRRHNLFGYCVAKIYSIFDYFALHAI